MKILRILFITACALIFAAGILFADVLEVPEGYDSIQEAIDASEDGDTVLVYPGEYVELIDFDGKAITVGSLLLTTGNVAYIDSTIIDGDGDDSVVTFNSGEDEESILTGFTITNGDAENGGGICIYQSGPTLRNLLVTECSASSLGGGIYGYGSKMQLYDVSLFRNSSEAIGGGFACVSSSDIVWIGGSVIENDNFSISGICIRWSSALVSNLLVKDNSSGTQISAFEVFGYNGDTVELRNMTVLSDGGAGIGVSCEQPDVLMRNLIVQGHQNDNVHSGNSNLIYSNVAGEPDRNHCIDEDPCFVDPENGDYTLAEDSPCIDTGDPDSPDDPDGSCADMGAFPFAPPCLIYGYVYDAADSSAVPNATVRSSTGKGVSTDSSGYWIMDPFPATEFSLTANAAGYIFETLEDLVTEEEDTLQFDFYLTHPEINVSVERIIEEVEPGEETNTQFTISNSGNGSLEWLIKKLPENGVEVEPWAKIDSIPAAEITGDPRLEGAVYAEGNFYVSGRNSGGDAHLIYIISREGELLGSFSQPNPEDRSGMKDLAYDPESNSLWGGVGARLYQMSLDGDSLNAFDIEFGGNTSIQAVAWDAKRQCIWVAGKLSDLLAYSPDGELMMTIERGDFYNYAFAILENDPFGKTFAVLDYYPNQTVILKANPDSADWEVEIDFSNPEVDKETTSLFITNDFMPMSTTAMSIVDDSEGDYIQLWMVDVDISWVDVDTTHGAIAPGGDQTIELALSAADLDTGLYKSMLKVEHSASGESILIPVELTVRAIIDHVPLNNAVAHEFALTSTYPNPFNAHLKIGYSLLAKDNVTIDLYDLNGRLVKSQFYAAQPTGSHLAMIDGSRLAGGLYVLRISTAHDVQYRKVALVK